MRSTDLFRSKKSFIWRLLPEYGQIEVNRILALAIVRHSGDGDSLARFAQQSVGWTLAGEAGARWSQTRRRRWIEPNVGLKYVISALDEAEVVR